MLDIAPACTERLNLCVIDVKTDDRDPCLDETEGERQTYVSEANDTDTVEPNTIG